MLFVDQPGDFRGLMPGFLPEPPSGSPSGSMAPHGGQAPHPVWPFQVNNLVRAVCGAAPELFETPGSENPSRPDFWDWWLLAARAAESPI